MLVLSYTKPPHTFDDPQNALKKMVCPCCNEVYLMENTVIMEAVFEPAGNDAKVEHRQVPFCTMICAVLSLSGGSRA